MLIRFFSGFAWIQDFAAGVLTSASRSRELYHPSIPEATMPAPSTLSLYRQFEKWPGGRQLFSRVLCLKEVVKATINMYVSDRKKG